MARQTQRHGTYYSTYVGTGCRCGACRRAAADYQAMRRARQRGIGPVGDPPSTPGRVDGPDGAVTAAVRAEVDMIAGAESRPTLVQIALTLAADLDTRGLATSHPSLAKQLRETLDELHRSRSVGTGRLSVVQGLAPSAKRGGPDTAS